MTGDPRVLAPLQQAFKETDDGRVQQQIVYAWCHETGNYNIYSLIESEIRAWTPPPAEPSLTECVAYLTERYDAIYNDTRVQTERLDIYGRDITELAATANDHTLELAEMKASLEQRVAELTDELSGMAGVLESHRGKIGAIETMTAKLREQEFELRVRITNIEHPKPEQHPEPTAPDDPVCAREGCGHRKSFHQGQSGNGSMCIAAVPVTAGTLNGVRGCACPEFLPAPQPAPDLDPVRVEAALEAIVTQAYLYGSARYSQGVAVVQSRDVGAATDRMLAEWNKLESMIRTIGLGEAS